MSELAIDGGPRTLEAPGLPTALEARGRSIGAAEELAVLRVLRSGVLSGVWGAEVPRLEREFAEMMGAEHAVASSSGTAALHLAVAAVDPAPGEEIIVPPITDMGTVAPIIAQNAVPVFADVDPENGCLDPAAVERAITSKTRAVIAVHLFGRAAEIVRLREIADRAGIALIEDCAQAYLAQLPGTSRLVGTIGHIGCFSLQQYKHITAGDGGLSITNDAELAARMRLFGDKGWPRDRGVRSYVSYGLNYRMNELTGAVAGAQLARLHGIVDRRRESAARLSAALAGCDGLHAEHPAGHAFWYFPILLDGLDGEELTAWSAALEAEGVPNLPGYLARPLFDEPVIADPQMYGGSGFPLVEASPSSDRCTAARELVERRLIVIPWNEHYTDADVDLIGVAVRKVHAALGPEATTR